MKTTQRRAAVPVAGFLALALLASGCAEGSVDSEGVEFISATEVRASVSQNGMRDEVSGSAEYNTTQGVDQRSVRDRFVANPDFDLRQFVDSKAPAYDTEHERFEVSPDNLTSDFSGATIRNVPPRMGTYNLQAVELTSLTGEPFSEGDWAGGLKLINTGRYELDVVQILRDEHGNTDFGEMIEIDNGFYRITSDKILFANEYGELMFSMDYDYTEVSFGGGDYQGYLRLRRSERDMAPVEDGQPHSMQLMRR